jgi:hypothetical protein
MIEIEKVLYHLQIPHCPVSILEVCVSAALQYVQFDHKNFIATTQIIRETVTNRPYQTT